MPRAPCCDEKLGLKKGPWTRQEDLILINYVQNHGHPNWRALPKHAGLLRCGKSCRLRWTNYLRPDIKRGNFTPEEEDAIIHLHQTLGNRWSAIAAKLPGRTDNEIKNVWHTHLKKRLNQNQNQKQEDTKPSSSYESDVAASGSEYSSSVTQNTGLEMNMDMLESIDDSFWTDDNVIESNAMELFAAGGVIDDDMDFWYNVLLQAEDNLCLPEC